NSHRWKFPNSGVFRDRTFALRRWTTLPAELFENRHRSGSGSGISSAPEWRRKKSDFPERTEPNLGILLILGGEPSREPRRGGRLRSLHGTCRSSLWFQRLRR